MSKNELKEIKVETPIEQQNENIPTEEWYYIPFYKIMPENIYWQPIPASTDLRNKQNAIDTLKHYRYNDVKIIKIRLPIINNNEDEKTRSHTNL